ncbi:MAG: response regulator [Gammaproteobacteria bacterium]
MSKAQHSQSLTSDRISGKSSSRFESFRTDQSLQEENYELRKTIEAQKLQLDWYRSFLKPESKRLTFSDHAKRLTNFIAKFYSPAIIIVNRFNSNWDLVPVHVDNPYDEIPLAAIKARLLNIENYLDKLRNKETIEYNSKSLSDSYFISILEVPLVSDDSVVGSIAVLSKCQRNWSKLDCDTITNIARTLAQSVVPESTDQSSLDNIVNTFELNKNLSLQSLNDELFFELPICILELDTQGIIKRVNAELANVLSIQNELLIINQPIEDLFIQSEISEFKKYFKFALNGNVVKTELITKIKFGNDNLLLNFIPIFDANDKVDTIYCSLQNLKKNTQTGLTADSQAWMQAVVAEFGLNALSSTNLTELLSEAITISTATLGLEFAGYLELSADTRYLNGRVGTGWQSINFSKIQIPSLSLAATDLFNTRKCIVSSRIDQDNRFSPMKFLTEHGIVSGISIGVSANNQIHGLLGVFTKEKRIFNPEEVSFLRSVSNVLAEAITRIEADAALRESEERFRAVFEQAVDSIVLVDASSGKILEFNDSAHINLHYTRKEFHKLDIKNVDANIDPEEFQKHLHHVKQNGFDNYESRHKTKNGNFRDVLVSTREIYLRDKTLHLSIWRDVTERRAGEVEREELQNQLVQSQKMEALGQLTGGIAHDFNNILASILGYTELAILKSEEFYDEKLDEYLIQVQKSGERARDLISQMLAFGRTSNTKPQATKVDVIVSEVTKLLDSILPATIEIQLEFDDNIPAVMMDPVQLHQIVMNLCINARDAMDSKGVIKIKVISVMTQETLCTSCQNQIQGSYLELCVEDMGCGIDAATIARIFEPFYSSKPVDKGTGMGLSVVHGIVHQVKGHILVDSVPDSGTRFSILFPITEELVHNSQTDILPPRLINEGHILVVDDEESLTKFTAELLDIHGFQVTIANSGSKALEIYKNNPESIDLVITDQTMPGMTGIEFSKNLKQLNGNLPIILCTGYSEQVSNENAHLHGISEFLTKPVSREVLLGTISKLLAKSKFAN